MASYWKHKRTLSQDVPYEFRCEHCGANSGMQKAKINAELTRKSMRRTLSEDENELLHKELEEALENILRKEQENHQKGEFCTAFQDTCPQCGKSQSWTLKALKSNIITNTIAGAVIGFIIAVGGFLYGYRWGVAISVMLVAIPALIGFAMGQVKYLSKAGKAKGGTQELPTVYWETKPANL